MSAQVKVLKSIPSPKWSIGDVVQFDDGTGNWSAPVVIVGVSVFVSKFDRNVCSYSYQVANDFWGWSEYHYDEDDLREINITPKNQWYIESFLRDIEEETE